MIRLEKLEGKKGLYGWETIHLIHCRVEWTEKQTEVNVEEPLFNVFAWVVIADGRLDVVMEAELSKHTDEYMAYRGG